MGSWEGGMGNGGEMWDSGRVEWEMEERCGIVGGVNWKWRCGIVGGVNGKWGCGIVGGWNGKLRCGIVGGVNGKWRCGIVEGWNEADKYADEINEVKRQADGIIYGIYNFPLKCRHFAAWVRRHAVTVTQLLKISTSKCAGCDVTEPLSTHVSP